MPLLIEGLLFKQYFKLDIMANIFDRKRVAKAIYDFSVDGGAAGSTDLGTTETIPAGAIITAVTAYASTGLGGGTSLRVDAGANEIGQAEVIASLATGEVEHLALSATTTNLRLAAAADIKVTIAGTMNAGVVEIYVEYILD